MKVMKWSSVAAGVVLLMNACMLGNGEQTQHRDTSIEVKLRTWSVDENGYVHDTAMWESKKTAIVVCDMWDRHWCDGATERVAEMAPFVNDVLNQARSKGVLIVHAPSDCMGYYKDYPGRILAMKYHDSTAAEFVGPQKLDSERGTTWPIDDTDEGCDKGEINPRVVWTKQIESIVIEDSDLISDSGAEIVGYFRERGIEHVVMTGVHTNMCIMHRSFGLRNLVRSGFDVALTRDLTDAMYNPNSWPYVSHFEGVGLMIRYIESYVAPTIESSVFTEGSAFNFNQP